MPIGKSCVLNSIAKYFPIAGHAMSAFDPRRISKAQSLIEAQEHGPGARSKSLSNPKTGLAKSKIRKIEERHRQCKELWSVGSLNARSGRDPVGYPGRLESVFRE